jgi:hypothetical protein
MSQFVYVSPICGINRIQIAYVQALRNEKSQGQTLNPDTTGRKCAPAHRP